MNGKGTYTFDNYQYTGQFNNGQFEGEGSLTKLHGEILLRKRKENLKMGNSSMVI